MFLLLRAIMVVNVIVYFAMNMEFLQTRQIDHIASLGVLILFIAILNARSSRNWFVLMLIIQIIFTILQLLA
jgi:hypothetical protein